MSLLREQPSDLASRYADAPFSAFAEALDVNWSDELEELHQESSRDHFLDVWTRRAMIEAIAGAVPAGGVVVDAGCSSGYLLEDLEKIYPDATLVGVDLVAAGLYRSANNAPGAQLVLGDVCDLPLNDDVADAVVSANLLEHVPDDVGGLREMHRVLKPGGVAAVVIPAGPGTYDYYDKFLGHERRYARHELANKAKSVGFDVVRDAYIGSLIYPPFWAVKKLNRIRHGDVAPEDMQAMVEQNINRTMNSKLGVAACNAERAMLRRHVAVPFGIRGFGVFRKAA